MSKETKKILVLVKDIKSIGFLVKQDLLEREFEEPSTIKYLIKELKPMVSAFRDAVEGVLKSY